MSDVAWWIAVGARELTLFAAFGLLIGGIDDLAIDLIWMARAVWRRATVYSRYARGTADALPPPARPGPIAVFTGAWHEAGVIDRMLATALTRWDGADVICYVGTYPNDPDTVRAVLALGDARVRHVPGSRDGPTTKAEALNRCWHAMLADEAAHGRRYKAVLLHDAEDVVHPAELRVVQTLIERFDLVQLPVLPLPVPGRHLISAIYCDEFAEAHGKQLVVREAVGAAIPSAGVGCAIARDALGRVADATGGRPFPEDSLTEDYEVGLNIGAMGGRGAFVLLPERRGALPVAVRAYFPGRFGDSVRQKARWTTGIALAGWDRLGWGGRPAELWMRARDRRAPLAALVLGASYAAVLLQGAAWLLAAPAVGATGPFWLLRTVLALLAWRVAMRAALVTRFYGWQQGLLSAPRLVVGNVVMITAAARAVLRYRPERPVRWDKTQHAFPDELTAS